MESEEPSREEGMRLTQTAEHTVSLPQAALVVTLAWLQSWCTRHFRRTTSVWIHLSPALVITAVETERPPSGLAQRTQALAVNALGDFTGVKV